MEVSNDPGFTQVHQKRVDVGPCEPSRNLGETKHGQSRGQRSRSHVHLNNAGKTFAIATAIGSSYMYCLALPLNW